MFTKISEKWEMFFCVFIDFRAFRLVLQPAGRFKDCRCQGFHQIPATWFTRRPVLMFWLICAFTCGILICMRIAIIDIIFLHMFSCEYYQWVYMYSKKLWKCAFKKNKQTNIYPLKGLIYYEDLFGHSLSFTVSHTADAS